MKIKRLEIQGFKSFVDRVSLDFQQDITGIVGPNGCGKSNVVDALRWAMGEQSPKNLRGKSMEDVIFAGSESRKPVGMAEVSIVFSTDDGRVPAKYLSFSEIEVTRRVYRDGESDYLLNRTPCRLLDITELFMDTGVGARAYSIIEQGKIGFILHSKPEERRFLIEEAAGVTKYKARKQVALKKMDHTRQNLLRLGDILGEIRRRLNLLQRQAKKAEKFREYRDELRAIELFFTVADLDRVTAERSARQQALEQAGRDAALARGALDDADMRLEERRIALMEVEKNLAAAQEELFSLKGDSQATENSLQFREKTLENLRRDTARLQEELHNLERRRDEADREERLLAEQKESLEKDLATEEARLVDNAEEIQAKGAGELDLARRLEEARRDLFSLLSEIAQLSNTEGTASKRLRIVAEQQERAAREKLQAMERLVESAQVLEKAEGDVERQRQAKLQLAEDVSDQEKRLESGRKSLLETEGTLQSLRHSLAGASSRLRSLQELEASLDGYGKGVRTLLRAEQLRGKLQGLVADLVQVSPEFETAMEAVLGDALQYVLAPDDAAAFESLSFLKSTSGGRGTLLLPAQGVLPGQGPAERTPLAVHATVEEQFRERLGALLHNVFIADDLQDAVSLGRKYPSCVFATRDGEVVRGGIVSGGSPEGALPGIIHKKREIRELVVEVAAMTERVRELETARAALQKETEEADRSLRNLRRSLHEAELAAVRAGSELQRAREERKRVEDRLALRELEEGQLAEERLLLDRDIDAAVQGREEREARKKELEAGVEDLKKGLETARTEVAAVRELHTQLKVRVTTLRERCDFTRRGLGRVAELRQDVAARLETHAAAIARGKAEAEETERLATGERENLKRILARMGDAEKTVARLRETYEGASAEVQALEERLRGLRKSSEELGRKAAEEELRLSEASLKIMHLESALTDRFRVAADEARASVAGVDWDAEERAARQQELERAVEEMGEVNLTAIDEYGELQQRFDFLSSQKADLEESMNSLQQAIQKINRTTRRRFHDTFHQVNERFKEIFPKLFCGGEAELRLTDEENLLETGIDIVARPPGKKLQNVSLLSGGEKALTALALIFAIFLIKPSPFCLLDEVDAPLDDANIGRFNDMLREMSSLSQFIVITHNKGTMAVADTLYGITMENAGVSRLVSVRLN